MIQIPTRAVDNRPMSFRGQALSRSILEVRHVLRQRELYFSKRYRDGLVVIPGPWLVLENPAFMAGPNGLGVRATAPMTKHPEYSDLLAHGEEKENVSAVYKASCFCGAVELEVTGKPTFAGYCHCRDCQAWSAAPINAFSLWPSSSVRITRGEADIGTFHKTENSYRKYCKVCGGHLMTEHPRMRLVDVYANLLQGFTHQPTLHANYGSKMVSVRDGLPKFRDLPAELGGSGETLAD